MSSSSSSSSSSSLKELFLAHPRAQQTLMQDLVAQDEICVVSMMVDTAGTLVDMVRTSAKLLSSSSVSVPMTMEKRVLPESALLGMIHAQRHQRPDKRRFQLVDVETFFVTPTTNLVDFARGSARSAGWTQTLPAVPMDIVVPPTMMVFHRLNCIWLLFREEVLLLKPPPPPSSSSSSSSSTGTIKSALSKGGGVGGVKSAKKHVRISQELPRYKSLLSKRKTIKIHHED
jgi:hypothetical protein